MYAKTPMHTNPGRMPATMTETLDTGAKPDMNTLADIRRLAGDCRAWAEADADTHPGTRRARRAADRLDEWMLSIGLPPGKGTVHDAPEALAERCGRLYRTLVDSHALQAAQTVNKAWADLTEVGA